jgi:hypothetical protein
MSRGPSIVPVIRLLDEDPFSWTNVEGKTAHSTLGTWFIYLNGYVQVNGFTLGWFDAWRFNRAVSRHRCAHIDRYLAQKADADLQRLLLTD